MPRKKTDLPTCQLGFRLSEKPARLLWRMSQAYGISPHQLARVIVLQHLGQKDLRNRLHSALHALRSDVEALREQAADSGEKLNMLQRNLRVATAALLMDAGKIAVEEKAIAWTKENL